MVGSFNGLHGPDVAKSLERNEKLWKGFVFVRLDSLIELRDVSSDLMNCDTLYLTPQPGKEDELVKLAESWNADEIDWLSEDEASSLLGCWSKEQPEKQVLRVWWD